MHFPRLLIGPCKRIDEVIHVTDGIIAEMRLAINVAERRLERMGAKIKAHVPPKTGALDDIWQALGWLYRLTELLDVLDENSRKN